MMSEPVDDDEPTETPPRNLGGRPRVPDPRCHTLRVQCNTQELTKFRILGKLNHDLDFNTMARDILLDEVNALLSDWPRNQLIATLTAYGMDALQIESLLKSL